MRHPFGWSHHPNRDSRKATDRQKINDLNDAEPSRALSYLRFQVLSLLDKAVPRTRQAEEGALMFAIQDWFVFLSYLTHTLYTSIELLLEAWFQMTLLSTFQHIHTIHWAAALVMITGGTESN